mmetsp:Transcript_30424/g.78729  ORF Transcript_30424/g.78729 Transcript_30424/m.78729 type:complete len:238 (-) Transcript_30424:3878-4591(-)
MSERCATSTRRAGGPVSKNSPSQKTSTSENTSILRRPSKEEWEDVRDRGPACKRRLKGSATCTFFSPASHCLISPDPTLGAEHLTCSSLPSANWSPTSPRRRGKATRSGTKRISVVPRPKDRSCGAWSALWSISFKTALPLHLLLLLQSGTPSATNVCIPSRNGMPFSNNCLRAQRFFTPTPSCMRPPDKRFPIGGSFTQKEGSYSFGSHALTACFCAPFSPRLRGLLPRKRRVPCG